MNLLNKAIFKMSLNFDVANYNIKSWCRKNYLLYMGKALTK